MLKKTNSNLIQLNVMCVVSRFNKLCYQNSTTYPSRFLALQE